MNQNTNDFLKKLKIQIWLIPLIMIIIGVLFVALPDTSMNIICKVIAISLIVLGIMCLTYYFGSGMKYNSSLLIIGIIGIGLGICIFIRVNEFVELLGTLLALYIIIDGIAKLQTAIDAYRLNINGWYIPLIVSIITITFGVIMLLDPFETQRTILIFTGIVLIYQGVIDFINNLIFINKIKKNS